jgi:hypothetical protein
LTAVVLPEKEVRSVPAPLSSVFPRSEADFQLCSQAEEKAGKGKGKAPDEERSLHTNGASTSASRVELEDEDD